MGTTLTGTTPQDTYDSLIKVTDNGPLSGTAKYLSDGLGNDSVLALSTSRVGVGTTSPSVALHTNGVIRSANSGNTVFTEVQNDGVYATATDLYLLAPSTKFVSLYAGGAESMRITSIGNVGIGTSSPTNQGAGVTSLDVAGSAGGSLTTKGAIVTGEFLALDAAGGLYISTKTNHSIILRTNDVERLRVTNNGLTFNGDTAAANALDDYEEGTWTPSLIFSGGSTGITYTTQAGKYVKIGSKVSVNCYVVLSNKGSSTGSARIDGLPFTVPNAAGNYSPAIVLLDGGITYTGQAQGFANINSTSVALGNVTEAGSATALTDTNFSNSSAIMISLTYLVS